MPARSYPDVMSFLQPHYDCELLEHAFNTSGGTWTLAQKGAVAGKYFGYCVSNGTRYPNARPENCDATVTKRVALDPELKAKGVRCTYQDNLVNASGSIRETGLRPQPVRQCRRAIWPATRCGTISFEQFIDVNTGSAASTSTGRWCPRRMAGDPAACIAHGGAHRRYRATSWSVDAIDPCAATFSSTTSQPRCVRTNRERPFEVVIVAGNPGSSPNRSARWDLVQLRCITAPTWCARP